MKFIAELTNAKVLCNELKVKDYKELLKCIFGDEPDKVIFIETVCDVFSNITNKPAEYFKSLNAIDFFLLLLETRINSQGDACKVSITKDSKQMSLELRLDYIRDETKKAFESINSTIIKQDNIEVVFECPSVERLLDNVTDEHLYFIKEASIKKNNSIKTIKINNNEQAKLLFEKLAPKISLQIIKKFEEFLKPCVEVNFLNRYKIDDQKLNFIPSIDNILWYSKLMFNESLDTFYDNLFYLSHLGHLNLEYVESLSPGEYIYMTKKLQSTLAQNSSSPQDENSYIPGDDTDDGFFEEPA
jgi:hypothetical protein